MWCVYWHPIESMHACLCCSSYTVHVWVVPDGQLSTQLDLVSSVCQSVCGLTAMGKVERIHAVMFHQCISCFANSYAVAFHLALAIFVANMHAVTKLNSSCHSFAWYASCS